MKSRTSLSQFLHLNERNLFWLFVASCLVFIANWFLATHGFFEFESDKLRLLFLAVSMCSPVIGILVLLSQDCRNSVPLVAAFVFLSMLLMWPVATITCFVVMLACWTRKSCFVGIGLLVLLQIFAGFLIVIEKKNALSTVEVARLSTAKHEIVLRGETKDGTFCDSVAVQEDYPVAKGIRLVKTFFRLKGKEFDYRKQIFSLSPLESNRVALVVQHGPRSQCVVIDLAIKNRLTEFVEDIY
ncbi:hypothetical protein BH11CYA1_BH11CYA1_16780 [soil metagenome]